MTSHIERVLRRYLRRAQAAVQVDNDYWERLACGQDTEEAEASGVLTGQVAGLEAALAILAGRYADADKLLDLSDPQGNAIDVDAVLDI